MKNKLSWPQVDWSDSQESLRPTETEAFENLRILTKIRKTLKGSFVAEDKILLNRTQVSIFRAELGLLRKGVHEANINFELSEQFKISTLEIERILKIFTIICFYEEKLGTKLQIEF